MKGVDYIYPHLRNSYSDSFLGFINTKEWLVTEEIKAHDTNISMVKAAPAEVNGGTDIALKVNVSCSSACDLWGKLVKINTHAGVEAKVIVLNSFDGTANEADEFVIKAPLEPGEYTWEAVFPRQKNAGILHEESTVPISFNVKSHTIIMEVYDIPSPIAVGEEFKLNIGVKCAAGCNLADQEVEIINHRGEKVGSSTLEEGSSPDVPAIYTAVVSVKTPAIERRYRWTARIKPMNLEHQHDEVSCDFIIATARKFDHVVTVKVVDKATAHVVKNAQVILRPLKYKGHTYKRRTNKAGMARLSVPAGKYQLFVSADKQQYFKPNVNINNDTSIKAELSALNWE
jgi:hypothetical protein